MSLAVLPLATVLVVPPNILTALYLLSKEFSVSFANLPTTPLILLSAELVTLSVALLNALYKSLLCLFSTLAMFSTNLSNTLSALRLLLSIPDIFLDKNEIALSNQ